MLPPIQYFLTSNYLLCITLLHLLRASLVHNCVCGKILDLNSFLHVYIYNFGNFVTLNTLL